MIFARSNRSMLLFGWLVVAVAIGVTSTAAMLLLFGEYLAALAVGMLATVAMAAVARTALRLRRWPSARLPGSTG